MTPLEDVCKWCSGTVVAILERREYTGCTVNFKTYTNSIWDKKQRDNPLENQTIFPDTHERIIEDEVFEKVQEIRQQRHRMTRSGRTSMFSSLVFCAECGAKMYYGATNNYKPQQAFFGCSLHRKDKEKCDTATSVNLFWSVWCCTISQWSPAVFSTTRSSLFLSWGSR